MNTKPFVLAPKVVLRDERGRLLLLRRSGQSKHFAHLWELPGGKTDPGEDLGAALAREVFEETGLAIGGAHVTGATEADTPQARFVYVFFDAAAQPGPVRLSDEHDAFAWLPPAEAAQLDLSPVYIPLVRALAARHAGNL